MTSFLLQHPFHFATLLIVVVIAGALLGYGLTLDGAQAVTRYTARVSFLIFALVFSINDAAVKKLGHKRWKQLHTAGIYYLWFVFFMTYLPRLQGKLPGVGGAMAEYIPLFSLLIAILVLRLAATFAPRKSRIREAVN